MARSMDSRAANSSCVNAKARRMIFAWGVRFIRLRSSAVSGCASRSARAAASMAAAVMGLSVLLEVVVLLILCRPSRLK